MSDLISRQAAIDAIHNLYAIHGSEGSWIDQKDAFKALNSLPSAQPTIDAVPVRHGRWVWNDYGGFGNYHCSECRKICICNGDYDYCPNCGARMDEE